jgi:TPP-dependent pyruvate/acetoin dehydrogenase alpha subunit
VREKVLTTEQTEAIVTDVQRAVDEAAAFAEAQPAPNPEDGLRNVFAQGAVPLHTT